MRLPSHTLLPILLITTFITPAFAADKLPLLEEGEAPAVTKIFEGLSPALDPGKGKLTFKHGGQSQPLELGGNDGFYGMGMIFHASSLPRAFEEEFAGKHVLQLTLGRTLEKAVDKVVHFGTIALIFDKLPTKKLTLKAVLPDARRNRIEPGALITFLSPLTPKDRSDEQKLKESFFSQNGTVSLTPLKKPESIDVKHQGSKLAFKSQRFKVEMNTVLSTPFNTEAADLGGNFELPVYWPDGKVSEMWVRRVASQSLSGLMSPASAPTVNLPANRGLTGSTQNQKNR